MLVLEAIGAKIGLPVECGQAYASSRAHGTESDPSSMLQVFEACVAVTALTMLSFEC